MIISNIIINNLKVNINGGLFLISNTEVSKFDKIDLKDLSYEATQILQLTDIK